MSTFVEIQSVKQQQMLNDAANQQQQQQPQQITVTDTQLLQATSDTDTKDASSNSRT